MEKLIIDFDTESECGTKLSIEATFEPISDYEETRYGERQVFYWHLINLKITPIKEQNICPFEATDDDYKSIEQEARQLAAKEAA